MNEKALTVTQISTYFKQIFDAEEMLYNVMVVGEISGLSIARNVAYFTIKDENAQMSCVCFEPEKFNIKNGDNVIITGTPRYYVKGGKLNFNVVNIVMSGMGVLYQRFLELKSLLQNQGYFDEKRKKQLPKTIKRIGVITSKDGAVLQDIINVRTRRNPNIDIVLFPVKVQGINAENEMARAVSLLDKYNIDVILIARGGGSFEDLQPFNTKVLADAIFLATKPVVSAVGHETDFTICDFVSDLRVPTPSAGAELLCENVSDKVKNVLHLITKLQKEAEQLIIKKRQVLKDTTANLNVKIINYKNKLQNEFNFKTAKLYATIKYCLEEKVFATDLSITKLEKLNPQNILKLGYATLFEQNNRIQSVKDLYINQKLNLNLKDGSATVTVTSIGEVT